MNSLMISGMCFNATKLEPHYVGEFFTDQYIVHCEEGDVLRLEGIHNQRRPVVVGFGEGAHCAAMIGIDGYFSDLAGQCMKLTVYERPY